MKTNSQKEKDTRKKLKLNKQTIKDLQTDDKGAEKVKGGLRSPETDGLTCAPTCKGGVCDCNQSR